MQLKKGKLYRIIGAGVSGIVKRGKIVLCVRNSVEYIDGYGDRVANIAVLLPNGKLHEVKGIPIEYIEETLEEC